MDKLVSGKKVADMLGISRVTVWRLERAGKLKSVRLSPRLVRYRISDVEELMREHTIQGGHAARR